MFAVEIDGKSYDAEITFYTAQLYEAEFRADIIKDLYGTQDAASAPIAFDSEGNAVVRVDFTKVDWMALTRILWAAIKTADDSAPGYAAWMRTAKGVNLWDFRDQVDAEMADCFFRSEPPREEGAEEEQGE